VRTTALFGILFVFCSAAVAADAVQPLDVKTGLWETTVNMERTGALPIPPEVLARLTPEQRAKLEERMKASQVPKTTVRHHCLTREELNKPLSFGADDKECHRTIVTSSRSKQEFQVECTKGGMQQHGTFRVEALSDESAKGVVQMTISNGDKTMNMHSSFTAKWVGPVCTNETK